MPNLKQTQETFWQLTQEPQGIEEAIKTAPFKSIQNFIKGKSDQDCIERMEIYSNMYFLRLHDILLEDFAAVANIIGESEFHKLCVDYLQKHPSEYYDISLIAKKFPGFIFEHKLNSNFPYLFDLAQIEWQRIALFVAKDAKPCTLDDLKNVPPDDWGSIKFQIIPAAHIITSKWNLMNYWKKHLDHELDSKQEKPKIDLITKTDSENILVYRKDYIVHFSTITDTEKSLLNQLKDPTKFEDICDRIANLEEGDPTQLAAQYLNHWLTNKLLKKID